MIDAAIATGDAGKVTTVLDLARTTNPDDATEIDAIASDFSKQQAAKAAEAAAAEEEAIRSAGLFDNWSGQGQLGAFRSTGNSSNTGLTAGLELNRTGIKWRHKLNALADFQRTNGVTTREQFLAAYEPNYQLNDRVFVYALGQYERDRFQGFSSRVVASGGVGYRVIEAEDGAEALARCKQAMPDLVLTDWQMPVMSGPEFVSELRKIPTPHAPKVLFCTSKGEASDIHEAVAAGADDYIVKPFDETALAAKLEKLGVEQD